jgi:hypothetical protein
VEHVTPQINIFNLDNVNYNIFLIFCQTYYLLPSKLLLGYFTYINIQGIFKDFRVGEAIGK